MNHSKTTPSFAAAVVAVLVLLVNLTFGLTSCHSAKGSSTDASSSAVSSEATGADTSTDSPADALTTDESSEDASGSGQGGSGQGGSESPALPSDDIYIFYTSDVHCGIEEGFTFPSLSALVKKTKAEHPFVALVDSGDYIQGGTLGSLTKGEAVIKLMNAMGYDVATLGNHEFDYGFQRLNELIKLAEFDTVACNIRYTGTGENYIADIKPYTIKDFGGVKVAFVGIVTPESITSSTPKNFMEDGKYVYDLGDGDNGLILAGLVQSAVDAARAEGADYVIALSHLGSSQQYVPNDSISLIHHTNGIDVMIDGHAHATIIGTPYPNKDGKDVLLSSVGTKLSDIGELIIAKDGSISTTLMSQYGETDAKMQAVIDQAKVELDEQLGHPVAETNFTLSLTDENGIRVCRSREIGLGNLITDIFREEFDTDVALINGGAIRANIEKGEVTYGDALAVMPYANSMSSCRATGQQILDALELGAMSTQPITSLDGNPVGESGGFLHVSGLKYTVDTSIPSGVIMDDNKMMTGIEGERRVKDVLVLKGGEYVPLDPEAIYTVASSEYILSNHGDGNTAFDEAEFIINAGPTDIEVFTRHLTEMGKIPEQYRGTEGRITIK